MGTSIRQCEQPEVAPTPAIPRSEFLATVSAMSDRICILNVVPLTEIPVSERNSNSGRRASKIAFQFGFLPPALNREKRKEIMALPHFSRLILELYFNLGGNISFKTNL